jgi:Na+-driven multidrug efflux pump
MFLFFFAFSMCQKPMIQLIFSIAFVVCNLILNIILFNLIGVFGLAVATALTYVIFYKLHNFLFNRIIAQEN